MSRPEPDLIRQLRAAERRDPVEAAFYALACLSGEQRQILQDRFNGAFGKCTPPFTIRISGCTQ